MQFYITVAQAMAMYSSGYTAQAIAHLKTAGVDFVTALEMLCAFDEAR